MQTKVKRAEELLNRLANSTNMTKEGKNWLIRATDIFHDVPTEVEGYPDGAAGNSVVQTFNLSMTLTRPVTVSPGDNWDCLIYTDDSPINRTHDASLIEKNCFLTPYPDAAFQGYVSTGGLSANSGPVGSDVFPILSLGNTSQHHSLSLPDAALPDAFRVISQGFEVRNETAELYKQGNVVVFEQPLNDNISEPNMSWESSVSSGASYRNAKANVKMMPRPPESLEYATILPGSKTWEAAAGCYVMGVMANMDNPPKHPSMVQSLFFDEDDIATNGAAPGWPVAQARVWIDPPTPGSYFTDAYEFDTQYHSTFNRRGAYFSGLSSETMLKVSYRITIERFPSPKSEMITLARPVPIRDEAALQYYSEIMNRMPVGVPVCENGLGDWFSGAVASIIDNVTGTRIASSLDQMQKGYLENNEIKRLKRRIAELEQLIRASSKNKKVATVKKATPPPKKTPIRRKRQ